MNRILETIVPIARCGIPPTNPTRPSVPQDFTVAVIDGVLSITWAAPVTLPHHTQYQLWSAPFSLSHVDSKTLIYEGDSLGKTLIYSVNTPLYLQLSARAGSYQSAFVPSTYGLVAVPAYSPPPAPGVTWGASITPSAVTKTGLTSGLTTAAAYVTVTASNAPTFTWTNPSSVNIRINSTAAHNTTFTGSGLSLGEQRLGTFWCAINDGANVASRSVSVSVYRQEPA